MISIASFLDLTSRTFSPPSWMGCQRVFMAILGFVPWSQMNLLMMFVKASSMCCGIPWALARNCVWPPIIACMMMHFLLSVRCTFSHQFSLDLMVSSIGSQGVWSLVSLPIHAPSILTASPSLAILILGGSGSLSWGFIFLVTCTVLLCDFFPISMTSVFSMLNLASDTLHQLSRVCCM